MAPLIAPHAVCPITSTTLAPATLHANSILPRMSSLAMFPATRALKQSDAQIHDRLGRRTRIDAAQDHCRRILSLRACLLLGEVVVRGLLSEAEALIAILHQRKDVVSRHLLALCLSQRSRASDLA